jgi:hypothetical protein
MVEHDDMAEARRLAEELDTPEYGYLAVRVLPDATVACLTNLLTTRAILLDVTRTGWGSRFCFADRALAVQRFRELQSADDEPVGYTARRPAILCPVCGQDYCPPGCVNYKRV